MMTHAEAQVWFSDMKKTSWIFPENSFILKQTIEEPEEEMFEDVVDKCESCFLCTSCFDCMCKQGVYKENHYRDFLESPVCEDYICAEEVNT